MSTQLDPQQNISGQIFPEYIAAKLEKHEIYGRSNTILRFRVKGMIEQIYLQGLPEGIDAEYKINIGGYEINAESCNGITHFAFLKSEAQDSALKYLFNTKSIKLLGSVPGEINYANRCIDTRPIQEGHIDLVFNCRLDDAITARLSVIYKRINILINSGGSSVLKYIF